MNILLVDDEKNALFELETVVKEVCAQHLIQGFLTAKDALDYANNTVVHIAFLDIDLRDMDGLTLAKQLKEFNPDTNIVFVTGYEQYALDSFKVAASDYILKPATSEMIEQSLQLLRNPVHENSEIRVQTFGNFDIFKNNIPIHFKRRKSKELLAYLIDRQGTSVTVAELSNILFPGKSYDRSLQKQMQVYISDLLSSLKEVNAQHIVYRKRNSLSINVESISCDSYDFLARKTAAVNAYRGEYMMNYAWAEFKINRTKKLKQNA